MELEFKQDFELARANWLNFWQNDTISRPLIAATIPKEGYAPIEKPRPEQSRFDDCDKVIDQLLGWAESHEFLAEAMPFYSIYFAADHFAALLGAELLFHPDNPLVGWVEAYVKDWDDTELRFKPEGQWWAKTVERIRAFRKRCDGKLLIAGPPLGSGLDCLSAIRGPENLLMDLVTVPEKVKGALEQLSIAFEEIVGALSKELAIEQYGDIARHQMYTPSGKVHICQCDFSCMISPEMFQEFQVPCLKKEAALTSITEYHLDGPDAIRHLEAICQIEGIDIIQWQPGAGEALEKDWSDLYRRIGSLGIGQVLGQSELGLISDYEFIKKMWKELPGNKLFFVVEASSRKQVDALICELETDNQ